MSMTPDQFLSEQLDELIALGYQAYIEGDRIIVSLSVTQAIFLQGVTVGVSWATTD